MKIGFIGLGAIGTPMAHNLVAAGLDVTVWNRTADKCQPLVEAGARQAGSPADCAGCDVLITMLADDAALSALIDTHDLIGALGETTVHVNMATVSIECAKAMAERHAAAGKTYIAVSKAVEALDNGDIARIVLARPAVEAGENIGFLPGDVEAKMAPYLRPLYDALNDRLGAKRLKTYISDGTIEIAPIGYMRGRTLNNAFVVIDEAQNCTYGQLKMLVTRLGWNSTMILTGDPDQTDLLPEMSGLSEMSDRLRNVDDIACVQLRDKDIVRHPLVASMLTVL